MRQKSFVCIPLTPPPHLEFLNGDKAGAVRENMCSPKRSAENVGEWGSSRTVSELRWEVCPMCPGGGSFRNLCAVRRRVAAGAGVGWRFLRRSGGRLLRPLLVSLPACSLACSFGCWRQCRFGIHFKRGSFFGHRLRQTLIVAWPVLSPVRRDVFAGWTAFDF